MPELIESFIPVEDDDPEMEPYKDMMYRAAYDNMTNSANLWESYLYLPQ